MKAMLLFFVVMACNSPKPEVQNRPIPENMPMSTTISHVYKHKDTFFDIDKLQFINIDSLEEYIEIVRESRHAQQFTRDRTDNIAAFGNFVFELLDNQSITISNQSGKIIKTITDPDRKKGLDNVTGNAVIFSTPTGVVTVLRFGEGYRINKYDINGAILNSWKLNRIYNLYYFAHSNNEVIFSSIYSDPSQSVIFNLLNGEQKELQQPISGIITDKDSLLGFVSILDKMMEVRLGGHTWQKTAEYWRSGVKTILKDTILVIANYNHISTGCNVTAYNAETGNLLWEGEVQQPQIGHSKYYNVVHLTLFENKLILEGNEAYIDYLQVLDFQTGKNLFSSIPIVKE